MLKQKREKHKIEFKGLFCLNKNQINSETALRFAIKCSNLKKKDLVETKLKFHESGFSIGNSSGLVNIRKLWFCFKDLRNYFIFDNNPKAVILVNKVKLKYFISYFRFDNENSFNRLINAIDTFKQFENDNPEFHNGSVEIKNTYNIENRYSIEDFFDNNSEKKMILPK